MNLRFRYWWLGIGWSGVVAIVLVSLLPAPSLDSDLPDADKWLHALVYAVLMVWFCQIEYRQAVRLRYAMVFFVIGGGIEAMQSLLPYRSGEIADWVADGLGLLLGWLLGLTGLRHTLLWFERYLSRAGAS